MKIIGGTTNDLEVFFLTHTGLALDVVKDGRIVPIVGIVSEFLMRSEGDPQVLKDSNQVMTSRFTNVCGIAATARISVQKMRPYITWNFVFEH